MAGCDAQSWAARALEAGGDKRRGALSVESVVGEEMMEHRSGVTATIDRGYRADAAVVSEPTSFTGAPALAPCSGGGTIFTVRLEGLTAHSCARGNHIWPGGTGERYAVNALENAFLVTRTRRRP